MMSFSRGLQSCHTGHVIVALVLTICYVDGYRYFQDKIPNGNNVQHPCKANYMWAGVGHENTGGGGARNRFGVDFARMGNVWTRELCLMDSDGDGQSNGEELGDPACTWREGQVPSRTNYITHPGVCEPFGSSQCTGQDSFVSCELEEFACESINRPVVRSLDVRFPKTKVPNTETNYFCMKADIPSDGDYFMVAGEALLDNLDVMHHVVVYGCTEAEAEGYDTPERCPTMPACSLTWIVWTVGVAGQCLPKNVGFRFGSNGIKRLLVEIHWNNPRRLDTHYDSSGMRFYYEPYRPDMLEAGVTGVSQTYMAIPPGKSSVIHKGICTSDCSRRWLDGPIQVFDLLHHMHYLGRSQKTIVIRDQGQKEVIKEDADYSYDNPQVHRFSPTFELRPGDRVETHCEYNSLSRDTWTYAGPGTQDEMCVALMLFYPASSAQSRSCGSLGDTDMCLADWFHTEIVSGCNMTEVLYYGAGPGKDMMEELRANCNTDTFCRPECKRLVRKIRAGPCFTKNVFDIMMKVGPQPGMFEVAARMGSCPEKSCSIDDVFTDWTDDSEDVRDSGSSLATSTTVVLGGFLCTFLTRHQH